MQNLIPIHRFLASIVLVACLGFAPAAMGANWLTSFDQAIEQSKRTNKPVMINFTGSDWCGWCIRLESEVFSKAAFSRWASEHVILLKLDFPRRTPNAEQISRQNAPYAERYGIRGFPTILFINADGEAFGRTGYVAGGPEAWLKAANAELGKRPTVFAPLADPAEALKEARASEKPLLVLAEKGDAENSVFASLLENKQATALMSQHFVVLHIKRTGSDAAPRAAQAQVRSLMRALEIEDADTQVALANVQQRTPQKLWGKSEAPDPAEVVKALATALPKVAYDGGWIEDFAKGQMISAQTGKPLMLYFTGSDWCPPCQAFSSRVLDQEAFMEWAKQHVVLVKLDFPRRTPQSDEQKQHNERVRQQFNVRGFPTTILLGVDGKTLDQGVGVFQQSPADLIQWIRTTAKLES